MTADNQKEDDLQKGADQRNLNIQGSVDESIVVLGDRNTINQGPSYYTTNVVNIWTGSFRKTWIGN